VASGKPGETENEIFGGYRHAEGATDMGVRLEIIARITASRGKVAGLILLAVAGATTTVATDRAQAQGKDLSDKAIATLMDYAWAITPAKFTLPGGKTIEVDKNNRDAAMIPIESARDVVRAGRLSANAQICGLAEEQAANYQTLMKREVAKAKWNDQQTLYISQLHLFTVMMLTGKVTVVQADGDNKDVKIETPPALNTKTPTCSEAERDKVAKQIVDYIGPEAAAPAAAEAKKQ
jgi:hypothetical protein